MAQKEVGKLMEPYGSPEPTEHSPSEKEVERQVEAFRKQLKDGGTGNKLMNTIGQVMAAVLMIALFAVVVVLIVSFGAWCIRVGFGL